MRVMVSNQTNFIFGHLAGKYPGSLGHLYSPGGTAGPYDFMPYALDNGAYAAFERNIIFDDAAWLRHLAWAVANSQRPLWAVAPDVVADCERTRDQYPRYADIIRAHGFRPAFAVQNGAEFSDVPDSECMLFIGGSVDWKLKAIGPWCARFPGRVHVGKVNDGERLMLCYDAGAVSVDGTGWWHSTTTRTKRKGTQLQDLIAFCEMQSRQRKAVRALRRL